MARIPTFTKTVLSNRASASNVSLAGANARSEAQGHRADAQRYDRNAQITKSFQDQYASHKQAEGRVKAQKRYNDFERTRIAALEEQQSARQSTPTNFAKDFDQWHNEQLTAVEKDVNKSTGLFSTDSFDSQYFRQLMERDRTATFQKNTDWESGVRVKNTFVDAESAVDDMNVNFALSNPSYKDFSAHQKKIEDYANEVGSGIFSEADQAKLSKFGLDNAASTFFDHKLQNDPKSVKRVIEYGQGGRDALTKYISEFETGRGSKTDQEIFAAWDKRLDAFEPEFQAVAFDALVSHGKSKETWAMIEQADGNARSLIARRQEVYMAKAISDPGAFEKNQEKWNTRLQELDKYAAELQGGGAEFLQNAGLIDSRVIVDTRKRIDTAIARKKAQEEKAIAEANQVDEITQIENQNVLLDDIEGDDIGYDDKMLMINRQELNGEINQGFAADARRYLESKKAIAATTNADLMAGVVTQIYDLNTVADQSEADYLRGVQNIKQKVMALRADGTLSRDDEEKLNNQLRTLTAAKTASATSTIGFSFNEANKLINESLPPELRGKAVRDLFYKVDEEMSKGKALNRAEERKLYKKHARNIVDHHNATRRTKALEALDEVQSKTPPARDLEAQQFLKDSGYTNEDVTETARKYGLTERQVIEHLRSQGK